MLLPNGVWPLLPSARLLRLPRNGMSLSGGRTRVCVGPALLVLRSMNSERAQLWARNVSPGTAEGNPPLPMNAAPEAHDRRRGPAFQSPLEFAQQKSSRRATLHPLHRLSLLTLCRADRIRPVFFLQSAGSVRNLLTAVRQCLFLISR